MLLKKGYLVCIWRILFVSVFIMFLLFCMLVVICKGVKLVGLVMLGRNRLFYSNLNCIKLIKFFVFIVLVIFLFVIEEGIYVSRSFIIFLFFLRIVRCNKLILFCMIWDSFVILVLMFWFVSVMLKSLRIIVY